MTKTPLTAALSIGDDPRPAEIWRAVQHAYRDRQPLGRREAASILAELEDLLIQPRADEEAPAWEWHFATSLGLLCRVRDENPILLVEALHGIRAAVLAHRWRIDHFGVDKLAGPRDRFVDCLARLALSAEPQAWELTLINRPRGNAPEPGRAARIRRRRLDAGLSQAEVAAAAGVERSTVARWEATTGARRPTSRHAAALARVLGGEPGDYVIP